MKELTIYFGKKNDSFIGFGSTADTIKCDVADDFNKELLLSKKWVEIKLQNGLKYVNTNNILWFDIIDKTEKGDKE